VIAAFNDLRLSAFEQSEIVAEHREAEAAIIVLDT
jgi:hypothetical protein